MTRYLYIDTSALVKTMKHEPETGDLLDFLPSTEAPLVTSQLTITELHRAARWYALPAIEVERRLEEIDLVPVTRAQLLTAGLLPDPPAPPWTRFRTLDAIHLAAAVQVECGAFLTYDANQSRAAASAGLKLVCPGRPDDWFR